MSNGHFFQPLGLLAQSTLYRGSTKGGAGGAGGAIVPPVFRHEGIRADPGGSWGADDIPPFSRQASEK